jgi:hypothetical protein
MAVSFDKNTFYRMDRISSWLPGGDGFGVSYKREVYTNIYRWAI